MPDDPAAYADGTNVGWQLTGFSKRTELVVSERPISREQIIRLRDVFDIGDDQWFALSYPVSAQQWPAVVEILGWAPPDDEQDYFVESYRLT